MPDNFYGPERGEALAGGGDMIRPFVKWVGGKQYARQVIVGTTIYEAASLVIGLFVGRFIEVGKGQSGSRNLSRDYDVNQ